VGCLSKMLTLTSIVPSVSTGSGKNLNTIMEKGDGHSHVSLFVIKW